MPLVTSLVAEIDELHRRISSGHAEMFRALAELDDAGVWKDSGARDCAAWVSIRYGMSEWKARRWLAAAHALGGLPAVCDALESGRLGVDKVVELARFAQFDTEDGLIAWAARVSVGAVRRRADLETRPDVEDVRDGERQRFLTWWYGPDGTRFGIEAELPAADGAIVAKALERIVESIPAMPGEEDPIFASARRADALVAMCSARIGADDDADRATVIVHVRAGADAGGVDVESGPVLHPETAKRLLCEARVQTVVEDPSGTPMRLGRMTRQPSAAMLRQLRYRDGGCTFPGCGSQRFAKAHHIDWWRDGGRTDLENLVLVCSFHHKLVHEHGWHIARDADGVRWFDPGGREFVAGPAPPRLGMHRG